MPMRNTPRKRGQGDLDSPVGVPMVKHKKMKDVRIKDEGEGGVVIQEVEEQVVIQSAEGRNQVVIRGTDGSMIIQDISEEDSEVIASEQVTEQQQYIIADQEVIEGEEVVTEYSENIADEEDEEAMEGESQMNNLRFKIDKGDNEENENTSSEMVIKVVPKTICHAYVIAKTVKEFRDLGRDMLRIHAENHGIEHASKMRFNELIREMIQHYNGVHDAGMEISKLDMLKLNMLTLKKIKVDLRDKTPPPDITKMIPKNVVPLEEQVHHVYEKRPDICNVDIIVNNLKDMLALGTSVLRPEASKHRVCNSSRKQKLQVVEELWEHYLKFHLKDTEQGGVIVTDGTVKELVGDEYVEYRYQDGDGQECIVVSEGDLVAGEDIHTAAEEVTA